MEAIDLVAPATLALVLASVVWLLAQLYEPDDLADEDTFHGDETQA